MLHRNPTTHPQRRKRGEPRSKGHGGTWVSFRAEEHANTEVVGKRTKEEEEEEEEEEDPPPDP
jgi:hypothetical protein